jgi:hypothetical protein
VIAETDTFARWTTSSPVTAAPVSPAVRFAAGGVFGLWPDFEEQAAKVMTASNANRARTALFMNMNSSLGFGLKYRFFVGSLLSKSESNFEASFSEFKNGVPIH